VRLPSGGNISFYYSGNTQAPSVDQLQPIRDNTDLLNQRIGNPDLKQAFRQNLAISFNSFKLLSERYLYFSVRYNNAINDFSTISYVDELGRRISKPVNVQGNYSTNVYGHYSKKITNTNFDAGIHVDAADNHNTNFINEIKNKNNYQTISGGPRLAYVKVKKHDFSYNPRVTYTRSTSTIRPDVITSFITQEHSFYGSVILPWKTEIRTDWTYSIRQKTDAFDKNNNAIKWNANFDKKILKKDAAILRLSAFDILDQNFGFQRNVTSNFISERTYDTMRRYFMLSIIYNFNKNGAPQQ
jgi:hypothetical protein